LSRYADGLMSMRGAETRLPTVAEREIDELWMRVASGAPTGASRAELRAVARTVVAAFGSGVLPEHLVIAVKSIWQSHSAIDRPVDRSTSVTILNDLVTLCIDEYFAARAPRPDALARPAQLESPLP
jgi:hypothetical protein